MATHLVTGMMSEEAKALRQQARDATHYDRWSPTKPATTEPPEWVALQARIDAAVARRKAKRTDAESQAEAAAFMTKPLATEIAEAQERACARAMSTPLPHDPPMSARLMPWRGE